VPAALRQLLAQQEWASKHWAADIFSKEVGEGQMTTQWTPGKMENRKTAAQWLHSNPQGQPVTIDLIRS